MSSGYSSLRLFCIKISSFYKHFFKSIKLHKEYVCSFPYFVVLGKGTTTIIISAIAIQFSSVQLLSCVQLFVTPWTAAHQASLSITNSWNLLKPMSIELMMPSNHLILCCPLLLLPSIFLNIRVFSKGQFFASGGQSVGVSTSASSLPMNIQDLFPLGLTGWISLQSKGLSRVFSNTTVQKHQFFRTQLSLQSNSHVHA